MCVLEARNEVDLVSDQSDHSWKWSDMLSGHLEKLYLSLEGNDLVHYCNPVQNVDIEFQAFQLLKVDKMLQRVEKEGWVTSKN